MSTPRDRLRAAPPGQRWVARVRQPDGSATDIIGWVVDVGPDKVALAGPLALDASPNPTATDATGSDPTGSVRTVVWEDLLAARQLPAAPGGNPARTSPIELEWLAAPAWVDTCEPLGEWLLRSGEGFTRRANSCLAAGDPGLPVAAAADRIRAHADEHQIRPRAQVVTGSEADTALQGLGWVASGRTDVLTVRLAQLLSGRDPDPRVVITLEPTPQWRAAFEESRPDATPPDAVSRVLRGGSAVAFAGVRGDGAFLAVARGHLHHGWLGLSCVWTTPACRRAGLATALSVDLGYWAARRGARFGYLQVATDAGDAQRTYARLGFTLHHRYHYLAPPDAPELGPAGTY